MTLEELKALLNTNGEYVVLAHGTNLTIDEIQEKIFGDGLYATGKNENSSLFHTTNPVDINNYSAEDLRNKMINWEHESKNIVFIKLPMEYFNIYADNGDRDCTKTRAFMHKVQVGDDYKYILDPKFIVGAYNIESDSSILNGKYEKQLTEETKKQLQTNLINLQKEMGLDIDYIEENLNDSVQTNSNKEEVSNQNMYNKMIELVKKVNDSSLSLDDRKNLIGQVYYYETYLGEKIKDEKEIADILTKAIDDLSDTEFSRSILNALTDDFRNNINKKQSNANNVVQDQTSNSSYLKNECQRFINEYKEMLSDGYIDDEELKRIIENMQVLSLTAETIKNNSTNQNEKAIVDEILKTISQEVSKMTTMQRGIEETNHSFGK